MLSDVLAEVQSRLAAAGVTAPFLLGNDQLKQHGAGGNRIVVIPNKDAWNQGATFDFNGDHATRRKPRISRSAGAEVHVWGVPSDPRAATAQLDAMRAAETLLHLFALKLREVSRGQYRIESGDWNNEIRDITYGKEYVAQIFVDVPVVDRALLPLPEGTAIDTAFTLGATNEGS